MSSPSTVHTLVLGAGPGGLAAADALARAGLAPVVVDPDEVCGAHMRSLRLGEFIVDLGRKELEGGRIPEVDRLWTDLLGEDFRPYSHRVGVLYNGHVLENCGDYRGLRRGMPWRLLASATLTFLTSRVTASPRAATNYQEYRYRTRGRLFTQVFSQGYYEKWEGILWRDLPPFDPVASPFLGERDERGAPLLQALRNQLRRARRSAAGVLNWRHPLRGSGQICEALERRAREAGASFVLGATVERIECEGGRVESVSVRRRDETLVYRPSHVIANFSIERLARLLFGPEEMRVDLPDPPPSRGTILVFLFFDAPCRFPHAWLEVTCPRMKAGRVTNFAAFSSGMVPEGKAALCVEYFLPSDDPLFEFDEPAMLAFAVNECALAGIVDPKHCIDHLVIRLPKTDAAICWRRWATPYKRELVRRVRRVSNLYFVQLPGTDKATYAGLEAAEAVMSGRRSAFDGRTDPAAPVLGERASASPEASTSALLHPRPAT